MAQPGRIARSVIERALFVNPDPVHRQIFTRCQQCPACDAPCFSVQFPSLENSHRFVSVLPMAMSYAGIRDGKAMTMSLGRSLEFLTTQQAYVLHFRDWLLED